jgi:hypothetical protein
MNNGTRQMPRDFLKVFIREVQGTTKIKLPSVGERKCNSKIDW